MGVTKVEYERWTCDECFFHEDYAPGSYEGDVPDQGFDKWEWVEVNGEKLLACRWKCKRRLKGEPV